MQNELQIVEAAMEATNLISDIKTKAYRDEKERFKPEESKIPKWFYDEWYIDLEENKQLVIYIVVSLYVKN